MPSASVTYASTKQEFEDRPAQDNVLLLSPLFPYFHLAAGVSAPPPSLGSSHEPNSHLGIDVIVSPKRDWQARQQKMPACSNQTAIREHSDFTSFLQCAEPGVSLLALRTGTD
jgi:hypothetical protein